MIDWTAIRRNILTGQEFTLKPVNRLVVRYWIPAFGGTERAVSRYPVVTFESPVWGGASVSNQESNLCVSWEQPGEAGHMNMPGWGMLQWQLEILRHIQCLEAVMPLSAEPGKAEASSIKIKGTTGIQANGYRSVSGL